MANNNQEDKLKGPFGNGISIYKADVAPKNLVCTIGMDKKKSSLKLYDDDGANPVELKVINKGTEDEPIPSLSLGASITLEDETLNSDTLKYINELKETIESLEKKLNKYITPVIQVFTANVAYTAPGSNITVRWSLESKPLKAQIICDQNADVLGITEQTGRCNIRVPYVPVETFYTLQVFADKEKNVIIASRSINIHIISKPPLPSDPKKCGYFITNAQSTDLSRVPKRNLSDDVAGKTVHKLFDIFKVYYPEVDFHLDWQDETVNAKSFLYEKRKTVVLSGGLACCSCLYYEGFCFIIAQSIARLIPLTPHVDQDGLTYVGVADFHAVSSVVRNVFYSSNISSRMYEQIDSLFNYIDPINQKGNLKDIAHDPSIDCRSGALQTGIVGGDIPPCAINVSNTMKDP